MKILLTNDDGIFSEGILVLADLLSRKHEVLVVAPAYNQSGKSHCITLRLPQKVEKLNNRGKCILYSMEGTPVDCVQFALGQLKFIPDLILSGINNGMNLGSDVMYSGTVGAAIEGTFHGYKSIALSVFYEGRGKECDFSFPANYVNDHLEWLFELAQTTITLNINIPLAEKYHGEKFCKVGKCQYDMSYERNESGAYILNGLPTNFGRIAEKDDIFYALQGYVTISPLLLDYTSYEILRKWEKDE